jgi:hypothetical protein
VGKKATSTGFQLLIGLVTVNNLVTPAHTLYQYLLSHEKTYGMQVFSMSNDSDDSQQSEYVLVRLQSTPLLSYHDAQDIKYTDDFDVALIVTWLEQFSQPDSREISLKYYLMLTSKRELYPKREVESNNKIGKFRTVYSVIKSMASSQMDSLSESSPVSTTSPFLGKQVKNELLSSSADLQTEIANTKWVSSPWIFLPYVIVIPLFCNKLSRELFKRLAEL